MNEKEKELLEEAYELISSVNWHLTGKEKFAKASRWLMKHAGYKTEKSLLEFSESVTKTINNDEEE